MLKMILKFAEERVTLKTKKKVTVSFYLFMSVICKFEEYIIKIGLKANLDRLVVMHAILMIWNLKRKQIVTCLFFFIKKKKETCHRCDIARKFDTYFVKFFPALSLPFNSLREEPKVEKIKCF